MSKFDPLWEYLARQTGETLKLTYEEIEKISGTLLDHSFLGFKKELSAYGWQVKKISMKEKTVLFERTGE